MKILYRDKSGKIVQKYYSECIIETPNGWLYSEGSFLPYWVDRSLLVYGKCYLFVSLKQIIRRSE